MRRVIVLDQTQDPGHEVSMGPGVGRVCAYGPCPRRLHPDDPPTKLYHHSKCRTADWKARKASQTASGVVAVRSYGPPVGDAQNAGNGALSKRAAELREARKHGTVPSDLRLQYARAVDVLADYLRQLNIGEAERVAHRVLGAALPKGRRG